MLNRVGLRLQPCFTPIEELKNGVVPSSSLTEYLTDEYMPKIHFENDLLQPHNNSFVKKSFSPYTIIGLLKVNETSKNRFSLQLITVDYTF